VTACPKGGQCDWVKVSESGGEIVHRCTKCGDVYTRPKTKGEQP
jgi:uncharacterized C2H2 Zn-finger protein